MSDTIHVKFQTLCMQNVHHYAYKMSDTMRIKSHRHNTNAFTREFIQNRTSEAELQSDIMHTKCQTLCTQNVLRYAYKVSHTMHAEYKNLCIQYVRHYAQKISDKLCIQNVKQYTRKNVRHHAYKMSDTMRIKSHRNHTNEFTRTFVQNGSSEKDWQIELTLQAEG